MINLLRRIPYVYLLLIPILLFLLGSASNQAVLVANWGKFPVMVNERQLEKLQQPQDSLEDIINNWLGPKDGNQSFSVTNTMIRADKHPINGTQFIDDVHSVMGHNSHLKFLADYINLREEICSPGDLMIYLGLFLFPWFIPAWAALNLRKAMVD